MAITVTSYERGCRKLVVSWGQNGSEEVGFSAHAISDSSHPP
jgi:hypothetical protein